MIPIKLKSLLALLVLLSGCKTVEVYSNWTPKIYTVGDKSLDSSSREPIPFNSDLAKEFMCVNSEDMAYLLNKCVEEQTPWWKFWE